MPDLQKTVRECLEAALEKDLFLFPDTGNLSEAGMNSLSFIKFIVLLEEELGIAVNDSDLLLERFSTIGMTLERLCSYGL